MGHIKVLIGWEGRCDGFPVAVKVGCCRPRLAGSSTPDTSGLLCPERSLFGPLNPASPPVGRAGGPSLAEKKRGLEILGDRFGRNGQGWVPTLIKVQVCRAFQSGARTSAYLVIRSRRV